MILSSTIASQLNINVTTHEAQGSFCSDHDEYLTMQILDDSARAVGWAA